MKLLFKLARLALQFLIVPEKDFWNVKDRGGQSSNTRRAERTHLFVDRIKFPQFIFLWRQHNEYSNHQPKQTIITYPALHVKTRLLLGDSLINLSLSRDLCGSCMQSDTSLSKRALVSVGFSLFPSLEMQKPNGNRQLYLQAWEHGIEDLRDCEGFLISYIYLVRISFSHSLHILTPAHIVHAQVASCVNFPQAHLRTIIKAI